MLHTFVALVQDKPGVLTRVASLFRRLNINIVSLTVGESERTDVSRMTIVCEAPDHAAHRIRASLYKLEITVDVDEVGRSEAVIRELCLIKVAAGPSHPLGQHSRSQIFELANVFRARVVDLAPESIMLEMTGSSSKIEGLIQVITESGYTILEVSRTGRMAMRRGHHTSRVMKALGTRIQPTNPLSPPIRHPAKLCQRRNSRTFTKTNRNPNATLLHATANSPSDDHRTQTIESVAQSAGYGLCPNGDVRKVDCHISRSIHPAQHIRRYAGCVCLSGRQSASVFVTHRSARLSRTRSVWECDCPSRYRRLTDIEAGHASPSEAVICPSTALHLRPLEGFYLEASSVGLLTRDRQSASRTAQPSCTLIQPGKSPGTLHVSGRAFWYGGNDNVHLGAIDAADTAPLGPILHAVDGTCVLDLVLDPATHTLSANDNMNCGGMNVRFWGSWHRFVPSTTHKK